VYNFKDTIKIMHTLSKPNVIKEETKETKRAILHKQLEWMNPTYQERKEGQAPAKLDL